MPRKQVKFHARQDSPFYKLKTKKKLANLLHISVKELKYLADSKDLYFDFLKKKNSGDFRVISAPREDLKKVQKRIADLLQRIEPPDYLFAPVIGRSYVDNAAYHKGAKSIWQLDIENFFPNCTANKVIWFFQKQMECSPDVAALLRGIVTRNGSLPQGSPCSPILAFLCYVDMWEAIERLVSEYSCRHSVYFDNLTMSGEKVPGNLIWDIKRALRRHGHKHNTEKEQSRFMQPSEITGVILFGHDLLVPNRQHKKLYEVRKMFKENRSPSQLKKLKAELTGRESQFSQIANHTNQ